MVGVLEIAFYMHYCLSCTIVHKNGVELLNPASWHPNIYELIIFKFMCFFLPFLFISYRLFCSVCLFAMLGTRSHFQCFGIFKEFIGWS